MAVNFKEQEEVCDWFIETIIESVMTAELCLTARAKE